MDRAVWWAVFLLATSPFFVNSLLYYPEKVWVVVGLPLVAGILWQEQRHPGAGFSAVGSVLIGVLICLEPTTLVFLISGVCLWISAEYIFNPARVTQTLAVGIVFGFLVNATTEDYEADWLFETLMWDFLWTSPEPSRLSYLPVLMLGFCAFVPMLMDRVKSWSELERFTGYFTVAPLLVFSMMGPRDDLSLLMILPFLALLLGFRFRGEMLPPALIANGVLLYLASVSFPELGRSVWLGPLLPFGGGFILVGFGATWSMSALNALGKVQSKQRLR